MHSHLCQLLWRYGQEAYLNSINYDYFDVNLVLGLWHLRPEIMNHNTVAYGCGSDVWANPQLNELTHLLKEADLVLYGHPDMQKKTEIYGTYWQIPVDTDRFFNQIFDSRFVIRDTLIYAPSPVIYDLEKVLKFIKDNPEKKITLIGRGYQDLITEGLPDNLLSLRWMPYNCMRNLYLQHREFRKWLTHPATPTGKMEIEAYLCGLDAYLNDKPITKVSEVMLDYAAIPRLIRLLQTVKCD